MNAVQLENSLVGLVIEGGKKLRLYKDTSYIDLNMNDAKAIIRLFPKLIENDAFTIDNFTIRRKI